MTAFRFAMTDDTDNGKSPLQRELPSDPIEALQAIRALMGELDEKAKTADCRGFDQALLMLFGSDIAREVGVEIARPVGIEKAQKNLADMMDGKGAATADGNVPIIAMSLDRLRDSARCTPDEFNQNVQRLSLGQRREVKRFIESREPLPAGAFREQCEEQNRRASAKQELEAKRVADWALGRK